VNSIPQAAPRWLAWWALAQHAAVRTTMPKTDLEASDAVVEHLVAGSWIGRGVSGGATLVEHAWRDSRLRAAVVPIQREWSVLDRISAIRAAGVIATVASIVTLVLQALEPTPVGPWSWLLPAACALGGIVACLAAGVIARAIGRSVS